MGKKKNRKTKRDAVRRRANPFMNPRLKRFLANGALSIVSLIVVLLLCEGAFRIFRQRDFERWIIGPEWSIQRECFAYSDGLSVFRKMYIVYQPQKINVLFTGDSFTYGHGVFNYNDTYPALLEKELGKTLPVQVGNAAKGGFDAEAVRMRVAEMLPHIPQDIVVYGLNLNDIISGTIQARIERQTTQQLIRNNILTRHSLLFFDLSFRASQVAARLTGSTYGAAVRDLYRDEMGEWSSFTKTILELRDACAANGTHFFIAVLPFFDNFKDYAFRGVHAQIGAFLEENSIQHVDLLNAFVDRDAREYWVNPYDTHPNEKAHKVIAETLHPVLGGMIRERLSVLEERPDQLPRYWTVIDGNRESSVFRIPETQAYLEEQLALDSSKPRNYFNLGILHFLMNRPDDAIHAFQEALRLSKNTDSFLYLESLKHLGNLEMKQGNWDKSIACIEESQVYDPINPSMMEYLAAAKYGGGDVDGAIHELRRGLSYHPRHYNFYDHLIDIYRNRSDYATVMEIMEAAEKAGYGIDPQWIKEIQTLAGKQ